MLPKNVSEILSEMKYNRPDIQRNTDPSSHLETVPCRTNVHTPATGSPPDPYHATILVLQMWSAYVALEV